MDRADEVACEGTGPMNICRADELQVLEIVGHQLAAK